MYDFIGRINFSLHQSIQKLIRDESGVGVIELVLILVVLIGLVAMFKTQLNDLLSGIFTQIKTMSETVY